jgi:hypothetical protein
MQGQARIRGNSACVRYGDNRVVGGVDSPSATYEMASDRVSKPNVGSVTPGLVVAGGRRFRLSEDPLDLLDPGCSNSLLPEVLRSLDPHGLIAG